MEAAKWETIGCEDVWYNTIVIDGERHWLDVNGNLFNAKGKTLENLLDYKFATRKAAQKVLDKYLNKEKKKMIVEVENKKEKDIELSQCGVGIYIAKYGINETKEIYTVFRVNGELYFTVLGRTEAFKLSSVHNSSVVPYEITKVSGKI